MNSPESTPSSASRHSRWTEYLDNLQAFARNPVPLEAQGKLVLDGIAGLPVPLIETSFSHGRGASAGAVAGFFGCPVDYDTPRNAVTFDRAWLGRRIEKSDLAYHALIRRYRRSRSA